MIPALSVANKIFAKPRRNYLSNRGAITSQTAAQLPLKPRRQIKDHRDTCSLSFAKPRRTHFSHIFVVKTGSKIAQFRGLAAVLATLPAVIIHLQDSVLYK